MKEKIETALYFVGVFGITVLGNVPLNNLLAKFDVSSASPGNISSIRRLLETSWNKFHLTRTVSAILSFGFAVLSLFKYKP